MKFYPMLLLIILGGCAKNSRDIVEDGRTLGSFEPKRDYVVDIPMGESQVVGEASGMKILGLITIGAGKTADGVDAGNRGDSTLGITSLSSGSFAGGALAPIMALTSSTSDKFKKAALRNACDENNCDILGYPMYNVNETNFFLFKTYDVKVKGFPGKVGRLENVNRKYSVGDSYWRKTLPQKISY